MKKVHIIFNDKREVVCVLTGKKFAQEFAAEHGYTMETYLIG